MERIFKGRVVVPGEVTLKALVSHGGFNTLASFKDCKEGKTPVPIRTTRTCTASPRWAWPSACPRP